MSGRMLESLVLLASALLSACGQPKIVFTSPEDASRLWVDEDNPVEVKIEVEGLSFPKDGSLGLFVNGRLFSSMALINPEKAVKGGCIPSDS